MTIVEPPWRPRALVTNRVSECYKPGSGLPLETVRWIVIHHCSLATEAPGNPNPIADTEIDMPALCGRFANLGLGTGGRPPYHGGTLLSGANEQALPLGVRGTHARGYNHESLAWCVIGEGMAKIEQLEAATDAVAWLVIWTGGAEIVGHTDLPGASVDPKKRCPRPTVDIAQFRAMVRDRLPSGWRLWTRAHTEDVIAQAGLVA